MKRIVAILALLAGCATAAPRVESPKPHRPILGSLATTSSIDFQESAVNVSDVGITRVRRAGGQLQQSTDGAAYTALGGGATASPDIVVTVSSPTQNIDLTLNGDQDCAYIIRFYLIHAAGTGSSNWQWRINQQTSNITANSFFWSGEAHNEASWMIANAVGNYAFANSSKAQGWAWLWAKSGKVRIFTIPLFAGHTIDTGNFSFGIDGQWTDTSTNVTKFGISSSNAADFDVGSQLVATPLNCTN